MRHFIFFIILFLSHYSSLAQSIGQVHECVEMTNIVFRLADIPEYSNVTNSQYIKDIDMYMGKDKSHEIVQFVQKLKETNQKAYEMLPKITACLDISDGTVGFRETVDLNTLQAELVEKGLQSVCSRFVALLNDFYRVSGFKRFFLNHSSFYHNIQCRFNALLAQLGTSWLPSFFEPQFRESIIAVSPSNGPFNYAIPNLPDKKYQAFVIIGNSRFDEFGLPVYDEMELFATVHELMHPYTNSIADVLYPMIQSAVARIYSNTQEAINAAGYYSPEMMFTEWLNNLFTIQSLKSVLNQDSVNFLLRILEGNGFVYMNRSLSFLEHFIANKSDCVAQDVLLTQFAGFINYTADHIAQIQNEIAYKHPYIVDVFPALNSLNDVTGINCIIFSFSVPMRTNAYGYACLQDAYVNNLYPVVKNALWQDAYTFVLEIDSSKLNFGTEYGILLKKDSFQSVYYYTLAEDFIYKIKTRKL